MSAVFFDELGIPVPDINLDVGPATNTEQTARVMLDMVGLMKCARVVMTDSGGIQEETTALGVPCLTVRDNSERPITVSEGTNTLVGRSPDALLTAVAEINGSGGKRGRVPEL